MLDIFRMIKKRKMKPKTLLCTLVLICIAFFCPASSFFNIDELKTTNYGIDIRNEPVVMKADDENTDLNTVQLTSKYGQIYQCNFPNTAEQEKEAEEAEKEAVETGIPDLLKPMETGPCLRMNNGWWNYEFCYGQDITQYHVNEESKVDGEVLSLGVYESEFDWGDSPGQTDQERKQNQLRRYHTQQYVNGTKCDLNGNSRRTEVRFMCEEGSGDYIKRVDEPETCSYIMVIHTTRICHHPFLKPPTPTKTVAITCHPLLTLIQYQEYLDEMEAKEEKKRQEAEKQRLHEEEQTRLAKERAKYLKQSQVHDTTEDELTEQTENADIKLKVPENLFQDMIDDAKNLQAGETPLDVKFKILTDPADVDEFIKKTMKEMEKAEKEAAKKLQKDSVTKVDGDTESDIDDGELDEMESNKKLNTDNMQRFGGEEDAEVEEEEEEITTEDVRQAVEALKKAQRDHVKTLSELNRLKLEKMKRAPKEDSDEEEEEDEEEEGIVEGETDGEEVDDTHQKDLDDAGDKLFKDVEKRLKTLTEKHKLYKDKIKHDLGEDIDDTEDLTGLMDEVYKQLQNTLNAQIEMEQIGEDLNTLLQGDKREIDEIKTIKSKYQDKRGKLVDIKQRLRSLMDKQYESIVKEAEGELGIETGIDRKTATKELADTLDGLLAKMDKTEQEIKEVDKELEQFAEFDSEEKDIKSIPPVRDDPEPDDQQPDPVKGPVEGEANDRVQVRVSRIRPGQKFTTTKEQPRDKQTEALEKSVQEELAKAGLTNGDKIQVKIITSYYEGDDDSVHTLSEKDSQTFRDLIVGLIGGTTEGDREEARHQEQEDNYSFVFTKQTESVDNGASVDVQSQSDGQSHTADSQSHTADSQSPTADSQSHTADSQSHTADSQSHTDILTEDEGS